MGEDTMVATTLTKEMIESGSTLIRKLDEQGLQPYAAFWMYYPEVQEWKLVISEVELGEKGPREIYKKIQETISASKEDMPELSLDSVALTKPDAPIVALLGKAFRTGPGISGIRLTGSVINGTVIDDAYIYRSN